jgi:hypothetical protein
MINSILTVLLTTKNRDKMCENCVVPHFLGHKNRHLPSWDLEPHNISDGKQGSLHVLLQNVYWKDNNYLKAGF